jgi:hypothetical protein
MEDQEPKTEPIEPEIMRDLPVSTKPSMPLTIEELAEIEGDRGIQVTENRRKMIENLRRASVMLTSPQDYLLFKTPEGAVTAYLQDSGCKRVWQIWGIEIIPKGGFTKVKDDETGDYAMCCIADGISKFTGLQVFDVEGIRYSTEDFCKDVKPDLKKEMFVKLAAVANRDGNIIRSLTGMKSIALEFLEDCWKGTGKSIDKCHLGKGYGGKAERAGADTSTKAPEDLPMPVCLVCRKTMKWLPATAKYAAFYTCPDKKKGPDGKYNEHQSIDEASWRKKYAEMTARDAAKDTGQNGAPQP